MQKIQVATQAKRQIIDITSHVESWLRKYREVTGIAHLHVMHTTAALSTADLDPGTDHDILDALECLIPKLHFRHPHDPEHAPDHILSTLLGTDVQIPVQDGKLLLGTWQRIILIELDGPRDRDIVLTLTAAI